VHYLLAVLKKGCLRFSWSYSTVVLPTPLKMLDAKRDFPNVCQDHRNLKNLKFCAIPLKIERKNKGLEFSNSGLTFLKESCHC